MPMRDQLHSEIDRLEEKREQASEIASVAKTVVVNALKQGMTPVEAMAAAAQVVGQDSDKLTSDAFRLGVEFARERSAL